MVTMWTVSRDKTGSGWVRLMGHSVLLGVYAVLSLLVATLAELDVPDLSQTKPQEANIDSSAHDLGQAWQPNMDSPEHPLLQMQKESPDLSQEKSWETQEDGGLSEILGYGTFDETQLKLVRKTRQVSGECRYPCKCPNSQPNCKAGVSMRKDGCECCYICTRQQGDLCDARNICDDDRGLYCDFGPDDRSPGICRAKHAAPCQVDHLVYKDGETFRPNCSTTCTCQNGHYACSSLCPWEHRRPSSLHCKYPVLVAVGKRCCKEWVCTDRHYRPKEHPGPSDSSPPSRPCNPETSEWGPCSQTCDMGYSLRLTNDNEDCHNVQERRLCFLRPCDHNNTIPEEPGEECKSTIKVRDMTRLQYGECQSTELFKPKYCSTCKKRKCCGPGRTKTRTVEFSCPDGKVFKERFMWIKNCECTMSRRCPFT